MALVFAGLGAYTAKQALERNRVAVAAARRGSDGAGAGRAMPRRS